MRNEMVLDEMIANLYRLKFDCVGNEKGKLLKTKLNNCLQYFKAYLQKRAPGEENEPEVFTKREFEEKLREKTRALIDANRVRFQDIRS